MNKQQLKEKILKEFEERFEDFNIDGYYLEVKAFLLKVIDMTQESIVGSLDRTVFESQLGFTKDQVDGAELVLREIKQSLEDWGKE